ncbi:kinase-like protein [Venturia nashicola]|uniref:Kinase-like protein n=1 Tax=Venturia nashicola TaxID=86259 RepID=A0A4Z1PIW4_9PEZI|nr:kinase-like protein [Venturia nashicola]TLD34883.1 kinase-like protein [Venturia nashicola]
MSSFFRSANDVTASTDASTSDASSDEESGSDQDDIKSVHGQNRTESHHLSNSESQYLDKVKKLPKSPQGSISASTSTEDVNSTLTLVGNSTTQHSDYVLHALLEERCNKEALAWYQQNNAHERYYTQEDPEVKTLAHEKYKHMVEQLGRHNLVPRGPEQESERTLRGAYREGLDLLSRRGPLPSRPALTSRPGSQTSLTTAMGNLALPNASIRTRLDSRQLEHISRSQEGVHQLPSVLQPYVDHPMVELSRYRRDYKEICIVGKGGYGRVYHVKHRLDGSDYAVKKIGLSPTRVKRIQERGQLELDVLLSELRMLARFDHPNIVRYYGGWLEYSAPQSLSPPTSSFHSPSLRQLLEAPELEFDATGGSEIPLPSSPTDLDVVFERTHSIGEILGELEDYSEDGDELPELRFQNTTRPRRQRANSGSTITSTSSKRSTVHSIGEDVENSRDADSGLANCIETEEPGLSSYAETSQPEGQVLETQLTLHIQMSLHPLSLADFLSKSSTADKADPSNVRHCFHLQPSLEILLSIMDGVEYLHQNGVVHRDLKPSNIFLTVHRSRYPACVALSTCTGCKGGPEENQSLFLSVRIGDFGLVTTKAQADPSKPRHPKAVGTELYRPPIATANADEKLDVFALGIIATELLFPFSTRMERQAKLHAVRNGNFPDDSFNHVLGVRGKELVACIKEMTSHDEIARLSCPEARARLESLLC